jgi:hypothetical protein
MTEIAYRLAPGFDAPRVPLRRSAGFKPANAG